MRIFHIAATSDWEAAQRSGAYTRSTLERSLADVGFIHAAYADQWPAVRGRYFAKVCAPLVLLEIDTDALRSPVIAEQPAPGSESIYPHIYGPVNLEAVVSVEDPPPHPRMSTSDRDLGEPRLLQVPYGRVRNWMPREASTSSVATAGSANHLSRFAQPFLTVRATISHGSAMAAQCPASPCEAGHCH